MITCKTPAAEKNIAINKNKSSCPLKWTRWIVTLALNWCAEKKLILFNDCKKTEKNTANVQWWQTGNYFVLNVKVILSEKKIHFSDGGQPLMCLLLTDLIWQKRNREKKDQFIYLFKLISFNFSTLHSLLRSADAKGSITHR